MGTQAMTLSRHGRACSGHPRGDEAHDGVDARRKAGHDGAACLDGFGREVFA
jgi:hypothetical protein